MPKITNYDAKCQRFNLLRGEMAKLLDAAEAKEGDLKGTLSTDEKTLFDKFAAEAQALKTEIYSANEAIQRKQLLTDLERAADAPRSNRPDPDQLHSELQAAKRDFAHGRYRLRYFNQEQGRGHENAFEAGLCMLARCGKGGVQEWALTKLRERGISNERLATITPFQGEDGAATGGYLVFPEFEATLINLKEKYGVLQREAYRVPMASDTLIVPRRAGGTVVYYPGENTQLTASAMQFDQVQLIARKYAQLALWSTELNEDSVIAMADLLAGEMAYQFAKAEDFNGSQGDGSSAYAGVTGFLTALAVGKNGIIPSASLVTGSGTACTGTAWSGGGQTSCINGNYGGHSYTTPAAFALGTTANGASFTAWNNVIANLPVYAEGRAKFYMHKTIFWVMIAPIIEAAGGNIAMYLTTGVPLKFLGYDVEFMQGMPIASACSGATSATSAAVTIPAVLGDMTMTCFMGLRRGVTVRTSDQRFIEYDQLAIQCTERVAINNVMGDSVAPTIQAGPMVGLQLPIT